MFNTEDQKQKDGNEFQILDLKKTNTVPSASNDEIKVETQIFNEKVDPKITKQQTSLDLK